MKKLIATLVILIIGFIIYSCAVSAPSWSNIGSERVYIEDCRDTFKIEQLDSALKTHCINPSLKEWSTMKYYTPEKEEMNQFVYTKNDTSYVINKINSDNYIFYRRYLNKTE
jgi:hypothetical protein